MSFEKCFPLTCLNASHKGESVSQSPSHQCHRGHRLVLPLDTIFISLSLLHFLLGEKKYGHFRSATYTPHNSHVSVASEKGLLLSSTAAGYYKLHTQLPLGSSFGTNKQLFSSLTFIPNLSIHKGAVFKCRISYKGKDKTVAERVSDKFTILGQMVASIIFHFII